MGEYWKPVNFTKKEFVHPHDLNCGLKWGEWVGYNSPVERRIKNLIASAAAATATATATAQPEAKKGEEPNTEKGARAPFS